MGGGEVGSGLRPWVGVMAQYGGGLLGPVSRGGGGGGSPRFEILGRGQSPVGRVFPGPCTGGGRVGPVKGVGGLGLRSLAGATAL